MGVLKINKYKFAYDFYETRRVYPFYKNIINTTNGKGFLNKDSENLDGLTDYLHIVNYINPYYNIVIKEDETGLKALKFTQTNGFMAQLAEFTSVEQYMLSKMNGKSRTRIRGYIRRLETCFTIRYKMFFGEISKTEYSFLFSKFHEFITERFAQRGDYHEALPNWDSIEDSTYQMILDKTASLFVIYNEKEPIDICLNYRHQNIIDNAIRSYDIAYSKFRLGYVDIYKQLEWCFGNGIEVFDLSVGDFDYKRKWCNVVYDFENHIVYDSTNFIKKAEAHALLLFYKTKGYLKKKNIHLLYHKIRKTFTKKTISGPNNGITTFELEEINQLPDLKYLTLLEGSLQKFKAIRKPIYDFQYRSSEPSKSLKIYKMNNQNTLFFVKGLKNALKINIIRS